MAARTETALDLALANAIDDAEVTLLHAFADEDRAGDTTPAQLAPRTQRRRSTRRRRGGDRTGGSRIGNPAEQSLDVAHEIGANQIVLGGRKRSPLGAPVFGSVSQNVLRKARRPSHRCVNCGEAYYGDPSTEIRTCRRYGGVHAEPITDDPTESTA